MDEQTWQKLGKVELHCHLDGSLSLTAIRQLAKMANIAVPKTDAALQKLVMAPAASQNLADYLKAFDFVRPLLQTPQALILAAEDVLRQAAAENVRYIELRFAPEFSMDQGLSVVEAIKAVASGIESAMRKYPIKAKILVCGIRQSRPETNQMVFAKARDLVPEPVGGFDFAGNELAFPARAIESSIKYAQSLHVPLTFHAGECRSPENIALALQLGITRIGHATACFDRPQLIQTIVDRGATVELCLTSNLQTKAARSLDEFPYLALKKAGANITINTDNRTVSNTNLTHEYQLFHQYFGCKPADFYGFNINAIQAAFLPEGQKGELIRQLTRDYRDYL